MQQNAGNEKVMSHPHRIIFFLCKLSKGTNVSPLLLPSFEPKILFTTVQRSFEYTRANRFYQFLQFEVIACPRNDENPISNVAAKIN